MSERIINVTCPHCKHGIKHDTLMGTTSSIPPEDYPELTEEGKAWCKRCQHGTFPDDDGLCTTCLGKGRETRLRPKPEGKKEKVEEKVEEPVEEEPKITMEVKPTPKRKPTKTVIGKPNTKVLR